MNRQSLSNFRQPITVTANYLPFIVLFSLFSRKRSFLYTHPHLNYLLFTTARQFATVMLKATLPF